VLLVGPAAVVEQALVLLMPHLDQPIWWADMGRLQQPGNEPRTTVVVRSVDKLSPPQQRTLLSWLDGQTAATRIRVVSTTTGRLYGQVAAGHFNEKLYYRLNTLVWQLTEPNVRQRSGEDSRMRSRPVHPAERRDLATRHALRRRMADEFVEMPGLSLTLTQASRLFGVSPDACARIFGELAEEGFVSLRVDNGQYGRPNGDLRKVPSKPSVVRQIIDEYRDTQPLRLKP
jgi:hypothetical protein